MNITKNIVASLLMILTTVLLSGCLCKKSCSAKLDKITEQPEETDIKKIAKF